MWFSTMSYRETTEDLNKLIGKLVNLITDNFKCCIGNYESLLPYLGKGESNSKVHHKLVQVNILLNKLNEELVGIRVEYVANLPYELKGENVHSEGGRKRRLSDVPELGINENKSMKMEVPFSDGTNCFIGLTSETVSNVQSESLVLNVTEETGNMQVQKLDMYRKENMKTEIQDSDELENTHKFSIADNETPVAQKSCDTTNKGVAVHFADDEVCASVPDRLVEDNPSNKSADTATQREANEVCVKIQCVKSETTSQEKCEDRGVTKKVSHTPSASHQTKQPLDNNTAEYLPGLYGIIKHKKNRFKCTMCNCSFSSTSSMNDHVNGRRHQKKLVYANVWFSKGSDVPNNNPKSKATISVCSAVPFVSAGTVQSESVEPVSVCSAVPCLLADAVQSENIESDSNCSSVSCSLADTVAIVEDTHQLVSVKRAVRLDNIWTYFHPPFHINKKYIRFCSGKIICYLCYEEVGKYILSVRKHIARSSHLDRINILRNIELENKSSHKELLDVPGFLKNIIPATEFSLRNDGFFCSVCDCFCENTVVLSHMTGESHGKKLDEMKKSE